MEQELSASNHEEKEDSLDTFNDLVSLASSKRFYHFITSLFEAKTLGLNFL